MRRPGAQGFEWRDVGGGVGHVDSEEGPPSAASLPVWGTAEMGEVCPFKMQVSGMENEMICVGGLYRAISTLRIMSLKKHLFLNWVKCDCTGALTFGWSS